MYRITLGPDDLMRTRIARAPDPFLETVAAIQLARRLPGGSLFASWRRRLQGRLPPETRVLATIYPARRRGLDLSTLVGSSFSLNDALERLCGARLGGMRAELNYLSRGERLGAWASSLADRNPHARRELGVAIAAFHDAAVASHWSAIGDLLQEDQSLRVRRLAAGGVDQLLATLCPPTLRWRPPVLELESTSGSSEHIDLGGRGLTLVPSVFVGEQPVLLVDLCDPEVAARLIYPVIRDADAAHRLTAAAGERQSLAALLGTSRAAVLEAARYGRGTGAIATHVKLSPAAVTHHTAILRSNGLITTRRDGATVIHTVTDLGTALLDGGSLGASNRGQA